MSEKVSLKQFLMKSGKFKRVQDCIESIRNGSVAVNNRILVNPNYFFNPKKSFVKIGNEKIKKIPKLYFIVNKPSGYLSQKAENDKTIYDLFNKLNLSNEQLQSLFAVGRLDKDTEGLMMATNDGRLSNILMDPKSEISKRYYAALEKPINHESLKLLEKGVVIEIGDGKYKTKKCKIKAKNEKEVYVSITEGKKRQIRKMFEAIRNKVVYLKRVSIGGLQLGKLKVGEIKQVTRDEVYSSLSFQ